MKSELYNVLNTICPNNVYLQGTIDENVDYPGSFITFWTNYTADNSHYDDDVHSIDWQFSVMYYSSDPSSIPTMADEIRSELKKNGFIPQGRGNDIVSDVASHTGWAMDFIKTEIITTTQGD